MRHVPVGVGTYVIELPLLAVGRRRTIDRAVTVIAASFRGIDGTEAAVGTAGAHSVLVDRPDGVAGGRGLGFNGGQLLALAVGGCLCNDLRYAAHAAGVTLGSFQLTVELTVDDRSRVSGVRVLVDGGAAREPIAELLDDAVANSTIVGAVRSGAPVDVALC